MQKEPGHSVNGKSPRRQRNEQDIFNMMEEYERSEGLSVRDFCELHDISDGTFYNWQKRYRQRNEAAAPKGFLQVEVVAASVPAPDNPSGALFAEVKGIRLYQPVTADYLKALAS
jgi:transposase-like protein